MPKVPLRAVVESSAPTMFATILAGLAVVSYVFFGPANIGGPLVYMVTSGNSMQPYLHRGDLAIVQTSHSAAVGEIHAYLSTQTGQRVLHRVIGTVDDRFIFKGDNNSWIDSSEPNGSELIGKLWFRLPGAGGLLEWLRTPLHSALLVGGMTAMTAYQAAKPTKRSDPSGGVGRPGDSMWATLLLAAAGGLGRAAIGGLLGLVVLGGVASVVTWRVPTENQVSEPRPYRQVGRFGYSADTTLPAAIPATASPGAAPNAASNAATLAALAQSPTAAQLLLVPVTTGQPVFVNVNPKVQIRFHYDLRSSSPAALNGTVRINVVLSDVTGWSRILPLAPEQAFTGTSINVIVPDADLEPLMAAFPIYQAITGHAPRDYIATLQALVHVDGTIDGQDVHETFNPEVPFRVVPPFEIYVQTDSVKQFEATGATLPKASLTDPFAFDQAGTVPGMRSETNGIPVFGREVAIAALRLLSVAVLVLAVVGLVIMIAMQWLASRRGEAFLLRARHGEQFVQINPEDEAKWHASKIEVTTMEDLLRLAQYHNSPILVPVGSNQRLYLVRVGDRLYAYEVPPTAAAVAAATVQA